MGRGAHAKRPPKRLGATGSGAPAKAPVTPGKFAPSELAEKNQEWAAIR